MPVHHRTTPEGLTTSAYLLIAVAFCLGRVYGYGFLCRRRLRRKEIRDLRRSSVPVPRLMARSRLSGFAFLFGVSEVLFACKPLTKRGHRSVAIFASAGAQQNLTQVILDLTADGRRDLYRFMQVLTLNGRGWRYTSTACNAMARTVLGLRETGFVAEFATVREDVMMAIDLLAKLPSMERGLCVQVKGRRDHVGLCFYKARVSHMSQETIGEFRALQKGVEAFNALNDTQHEPLYLAFGLSGTNPWDISADEEFKRKLRYLYC